MNYLLVLLGAFIWLLFKAQSASRLKSYTLEGFVSRNIFPFLINITVGASFVLAEIPVAFNIGEVDMEKAVWIFIGAGGQIFFRKLYKQFFERIK